jgi:hypothetical protein
MPRVIINTSKYLPPFPFLTWNKAAIRRVLGHYGIDPDADLRMVQCPCGGIEYIQGEDDAKCIQSTAIRYGGSIRGEERKDSDEQS